MSGSSERFQAVFLEVFESLPRQGPGNRECAARALDLCSELPPAPAILDLGCGAGGQTLLLAELLPSSSIVAIDTHAPGIERLRATVAQRGLTSRIAALVGDMARPDPPAASFDLVWSEGALYSIGLRPALQVCHDMLRPGGYLAFTDAVWRTDRPTPEVRAMFEQDYPGMGQVTDDVAAIRDAGFALVGHFTLPDAAWWDDFYAPMEARIAQLRHQYAGDAETLAALDQLADEPAMHRRHGGEYAYEFFVARRPGPPEPR